MPTVYVTQVPHRRDGEAFVPSINIGPATEHGTLVVMMPPRAPFVTTHDLFEQLRFSLQDYDAEAGDCLLPLGDPVVAAAACAVLAIEGPFTILRWDRNVGRYVAVRLDP